MTRKRKASNLGDFVFLLLGLLPGMKDLQDEERVEKAGGESQ